MLPAVFTASIPGFAPCHKCGGAGRIAGYAHVRGGVCFRCGGSGYVDAATRAAAPSAVVLAALRGPAVEVDDGPRPTLDDLIAMLG